MTHKYTIEAQNIYGSIALEFVGRRYKTMKAALKDFDSTYNRRGWSIVIFVDGPADEHYEPRVARIVKSTYR